MIDFDHLDVNIHFDHLDVNIHFDYLDEKIHFDYYGMNNDHFVDNHRYTNFANLKK